MSKSSKARVLQDLSQTVEPQMDESQIDESNGDTALPELKVNKEGNTIFSIECDNIRVPFDELSPKALNYMLEYGLRQSAKDSVAGLMGNGARRAKLRAEGKSEAEIDSIARETYVEKIGKILRGEVDIRNGGPKLVGVAKIARDKALVVIRNAYAKAKKTLPTGESLRKLLQVAVEKNVGNCRTEAEIEFKRLQGLSVTTEDLAAMMEMVA